MSVVPCPIKVDVKQRKKEEMINRKMLSVRNRCSLLNLGSSLEKKRYWYAQENFSKYSE